MKVAHLNTHNFGGSWEAANALAFDFKKLGIQYQHFFREKNVVPFWDRAFRRLSLSFATGAWHGTRRLLEGPAMGELESVDIVHLHTVADWFDVPRWLTALPRQMKVVVSLHDLWHLSGGCFVYDGCEKFSKGCRSCPLLKFPANMLFARDEFRRKAKAYRNRHVHFIANSGWLEQKARESQMTSECEISVIPPPVNFSVFRPLDRSHCRRAFGLGQDQLVVATGCASLTDKNKDTPGLLKILASVKVPHLKVIIFGEGKIEVPGGLDVCFTGPINSKDRMAQLYNAADLFVSGSKMETYGLTFVEAMACGTPVVGHRVGGIPEAVLDGEFASLCALGDRDAMSGAIASALLSNRRVSAEVIERLKARNGSGAVASKLAMVYRAIAG